MEIKIVHSNLGDLDLNLSVSINGLDFQIYWRAVNGPGEVVCLSQFESMTEAELKNLLSSFKEAKTVLQAECNTLESLIKPYKDFVASHSGSNNV